MSQATPDNMAGNCGVFTLMLYVGPPTTHTQAVDITDQGQRINWVYLYATRIRF